MFKILFIGDIFGEPGRKAVKSLLPGLREKHKIDFVVANCENTANGRGINKKLAQDLLATPIDVMTSGNHIWHSSDIYPYLNDPQTRVLRPANLPQSAPGRGAAIAEAKGIRVAVFNIMGQVFMNPPTDNPFDCVDRLIDRYQDESDLMVLDMHAETTSEKKCMGWYVDGVVQAVVGTHTHVQTADEQILTKGTAYITDLGMTGPQDSVIGMKKESVIHRQRTTLPIKFEVAEDDVRLHGALVEIDERSKKSINITRIMEKVSF